MRASTRTLSRKRRSTSGTQLLYVCWLLTVFYCPTAAQKAVQEEPPLNPNRTRTSVVDLRTRLPQNGTARARRAPTRRRVVSRPATPAITGRVNISSAALETAAVISEPPVNGTEGEPSAFEAINEPPVNGTAQEEVSKVVPDTPRGAPKPPPKMFSMMDFSEPVSTAIAERSASPPSNSTKKDSPSPPRPQPPRVIIEPLPSIFSRMDFSGPVSGIVVLGSRFPFNSTQGRNRTRAVQNVPQVITEPPRKSPTTEANSTTSVDKAGPTTAELPRSRKRLRDNLTVVEEAAEVETEILLNSTLLEDNSTADAEEREVDAKLLLNSSKLEDNSTAVMEGGADTELVPEETQAEGNSTALVAEIPVNTTRKEENSTRVANPAPVVNKLPTDTTRYTAISTAVAEPASLVAPFSLNITRSEPNATAVAEDVPTAEGTTSSIIYRDSGAAASIFPVVKSFSYQTWDIFSSRATTYFPFAVALRRGPYGNHLCSGVLIAPQHVLTAAHCLDPRLGTGSSRPSVVIGAFSGNNTGSLARFEVMAVTSILFHNDFGVYGHPDLAILRLDRPSTQSPIGLPTTGFVMPNNLFHLRWIRTSVADLLSQTVEKTLVSVTDPSKCRATSSVTFCTEGEPPGACEGDEGGPVVFHDTLQKKDILVGIVGLNKGCQEPVQANIHTDLLPHLAWIQASLSQASKAGVPQTYGRGFRHSVLDGLAG